jgi:hypothetical protein
MEQRAASSIDDRIAWKEQPGEAFSIPGIERSTTRWWAAAMSSAARTGHYAVTKNLAATAAAY